MIATSYFASKLIRGKGLRLISISLVTRYCKCERYLKLAPTREMIELAHDGKFEEYTRLYQRDVLGTLDPLEVYEELDGAVLLCWEKAGSFCHRRLVAEWLANAVGKEVPELDENLAMEFELITALHKARERKVS